MKAIYIAAPRADTHVGPAMRTIETVMRKPPVVVSVHDPLDEALIEMIHAGLRHLVAIDGAGRCAGVLSDRTIASAWVPDYAALTRRTVASALSRHTVASALDAEPAIIGSDATVVETASLMRRRGLDAVAVVDSDGMPVGLVTGSDLVALLAR